MPAHTFTEFAQAPQVSRNRVVLIEPSHDTPEPFPHPSHRLVHPRSKRLLNLLQLRFQPFADRLPPNGESPFAGSPATVRESQKREAFRLFLATRLPIDLRESAELNQPSLARV
jgi:hypothetical protein